MTSRTRARRALFPINVWPAMVDALTLVLAAFVLIMLVAILAGNGLVGRLRERERELTQIKEERAQIERRLHALAATGTVEIDDGKVIVQGEILFDSGSDEIKPEGRAFLERLATPLHQLLEAQAGHMVLIGGHTDDRPIRTPRFASNWDLSSARAVAVARVLVASGLPSPLVMAAGFGEHHPRHANVDDPGRQKNRRIEVMIVPLRAVSSSPQNSKTSKGPSR
jgi:flagellar motor protein MotB